MCVCVFNIRSHPKQHSSQDRPTRTTRVHLVVVQNLYIMSTPPPGDLQSAAAAAIADAKIPPGEDYEEIREQVS